MWYQPVKKAGTPPKNYSENCLEPANKTKNRSRETSSCMKTLILQVLLSPHELLSTVMPRLQP